MFYGSFISTRISTLPRSIPKDLFQRQASSMSSLSWVVGPSCAISSVSESGTARWCGGMCASIMQLKAWRRDSTYTFFICCGILPGACNRYKRFGRAGDSRELEINLNNRSQVADSPVSVGTALSQYVDELRSNRCGNGIRLPGGSHRHPGPVLWRKIAENHVPGGYLLQRLADDRHAKPRRNKGERAGGAVRLLDNSRLKTHAPANFREPITIIP